MLLVVAGFVVLLLRHPVRQGSRRPLSAAERVYVIIALVPVLLALAVPSIIVSTVGTGLAAREWGNRLSNSGIWLSLGLTVVGVYFLLQKRRQGAGPRLWLCAAVGVAAVPAC